MLSGLALTLAVGIVTSPALLLLISRPSVSSPTSTSPISHLPIADPGTGIYVTIEIQSLKHKVG